MLASKAPLITTIFFVPDTPCAFFSIRIVHLSIAGSSYNLFIILFKILIFLVKKEIEVNGGSCIYNFSSQIRVISIQKKYERFLLEGSKYHILDNNRKIFIVYCL